MAETAGEEKANNLSDWQETFSTPSVNVWLSRRNSIYHGIHTIENEVISQA